MRKPRLLDLYCGAGGAAMGYHRAGFDVVGVDIRPQPHYPFEFHLGDALEFCRAHSKEYDLIHASPPCQAYTQARGLPNVRRDHVDMIGVTRSVLVETGKAFVIENVPNAPLRNPLMLCGTMFGLGVLRHRLFECNPVIWFPPASCCHDGLTMPLFWKSIKEIEASPVMRSRYKFITVAGRSSRMSQAKQAMKIDWMTQAEISQAIPPAFTEYVGTVMFGLLHFAA